jgi:hypothetical protein
VRAIAAQALAALPDSAYTARMRTRFDALRRPDGTYDLPAELPPDWRRDGIAESAASTGFGQRSGWLRQLVALLPPALSAPAPCQPAAAPDATLSAPPALGPAGEAYPGQDHAEALGHGHVEAIVRTADVALAAQAWDAFQLGLGPSNPLRTALLPLLPASLRTAEWLAGLKEARNAYHAVAAAAPHDLDEAATDAWLQALAADLAAAAGTADGPRRWTHLLYVQEATAYALAPPRLGAIAASLDALAAHHDFVAANVGEWRRFRTIIDLRRRIHEEIAP